MNPNSPRVTLQTAAILRDRMHENLRAMGPEAMLAVLGDKIRNGDHSELSKLSRPERRRLEKELNIKIPTAHNGLDRIVRKEEFADEVLRSSTDRLIRSKVGPAHSPIAAISE